MIFIDTNVAIDLRDDAPHAGPRLAALTPFCHISVFTLIELEGGVERDPQAAPVRRRLLELLLRELEVVMLTEEDVKTYGRIVAALGFNRSRILDRLIAAQALTRGASLVTANTADFAEIPGLTLIAW